MYHGKEFRRYAKRLGYDTFKDKQAEAIKAVCKGKDTTVIA